MSVGALMQTWTRSYRISSGRDMIRDVEVKKPTQKEINYFMWGCCLRLRCPPKRPRRRLRFFRLIGDLLDLFFTCPQTYIPCGFYR